VVEEIMDDNLLLLQMAFSVVGDTPEWFNMSAGARLEEVKRTYEKLEKIVEGVPLDDSKLN